jgi:UDP-N-acetylmuramoyl-tripeptide--D-alanyl-D-alanine ligase
MVGVRAAEVVDELITVGQLGAVIAYAAHEAGLPMSRITEMADSQEAIDFLQGRLGPKDVVLIKGSHGMHMERIVAALEVGQ